MTHAPRHRADCAAGFTLIEVLVAFTIAVLLLGALYRIFSTGLVSSAAAERYSGAVLLAESSLEELANAAGVPEAATDRVGIYERRTTIEKRPDLVPPNLSIAVVPYEIAVRILWRDGVRERAVALSTLRLAVPP